MAYILTLLVVCATFFLASPVQDGIDHTVASVVRSFANAPAIHDLRLKQRFEEVKRVVREKSMQLLREQLHAVIDDSVK